MKKSSKCCSICGSYVTETLPMEELSWGELIKGRKFEACGNCLGKAYDQLDYKAKPSTESGMIAAVRADFGLQVIVLDYLSQNLRH